MKPRMGKVEQIKIGKAPEGVNAART